MAGIEVGGAGVGVNPQNISGSEAYKFRQGQGEESINRMAGAKGTLLTGGTIKDALAFNSGLASQEYGNEWQRQFGLAGLNADIQGGNANRTLGGLTSLYSGGLSAAGGQAGLYNQSGNAAAQGTYGQANAMNAGIGGVAGSLGEYFANRNQPQQPNLGTNMPPGSPAMNYGASRTGGAGGQFPTY